MPAVPLLLSNPALVVEYDEEGCSRNVTFEAKLRPGIVLDVVNDNSRFSLDKCLTGVYVYERSPSSVSEYYEMLKVQLGLSCLAGAIGYIDPEDKINPDMIYGMSTIYMWIDTKTFDSLWALASSANDPERVLLLTLEAPWHSKGVKFVPYSGSTDMEWNTLEAKQELFNKARFQLVPLSRLER